MPSTASSSTKQHHRPSLQRRQSRREKLLCFRCRQSIRQGRRRIQRVHGLLPSSWLRETQGPFRQALQSETWSSCPAWSRPARTEGKQYIELKTVLTGPQEISRWRWRSKPRTQIQCREWMTPISRVTTTCPSPETNGILSDDYRYAGFRQEHDYPVERHLLEAQQAGGRQQSRDPDAWR